jgi:hypothetical protein
VAELDLHPPETPSGEGALKVYGTGETKPAFDLNRV